MKNLNYTWAFLVIILSISGCLGKKQLEVKFKDPSAFQTTTGNLNISTVAVVSNQLIIRGSGLGDITSVKLSEGGVDQTLTVESATAGEIVAKGVSAVNIGVGKIFDMILSDANGSVTFPVSFSLDNGSVTAAMLAPMGATPGQVLKYTLTGWAPVSQTETQAYIGTWDATTTIPDITATVAGDYYVVSVAGGTYAVGDWIISDGYAWSKLAYSKTSVSSFQGRKGIVTLVPADYVSLKAATTPFKIPGSSINDFLDVDLSTAPLDGQVLKYTTAGGLNKWVAGTAGSASNIGLSDLSATAPLSYNNTTGVFSLATADLLATPLTSLASGSGAVTATDTLLGAFGKLMAVPSDYVSKSSGATMTTGTIALSGTAMITVPTASGVTATEVANVTYVNNMIGGNGVWAKGSGGSAGTINFSTGNVGIGTTTPTSKLEVSGTGLFTGALTVNTGAGANTFTLRDAIFSKTAGQPMSLNTGLSTVASTGVSSGWTVRDTNNGMWAPAVNSIAFTTNSVDRVLIDSSGYVGIGTPSPTAQLHLTQPAAGTTAQIIKSAVTPTAGALEIQNSAGAVLSVIGFNGGANFTNEVLTSTQFKGTRTIMATGDATNPSYNFTNDTATNTGMFRAAEDTLAFSTGGIERFRISSTGKVTISAGSDFNNITDTEVVTKKTLTQLAPNFFKSKVIALNSPAWTNYVTNSFAAFNTSDFQRGFSGNNVAGGTITSVLLSGNASTRSRIGNSRTANSWGSIDWGSKIRIMAGFSGVPSAGRTSLATDSFGVSFGTHTSYDITAGGMTHLMETATPASSNYLVGFKVVNGNVTLWVKNGTGASTGSATIATLSDANDIGQFVMEVSGGTLSLYRNNVFLGSTTGAPTAVSGPGSIAVGLDSTATTSREFYLTDLAIAWE